LEDIVQSPKKRKEEEKVSLHKNSQSLNSFDNKTKQL